MEFVKNPVYRKEFKTDGGFRLFEAKGDWLVFRCQPSSYIVPGESKKRTTVDLILQGTIFIELPTLIHGFKLTRPRDNLSKSFADQWDRNNFWGTEEERVYAIETEGNRFHIVGANLWIQILNERISESPLSHFYHGSLEQYNEYLERYVEEWIKIE